PGDHLVNDTIFLRLDRIHDEVAVGVVRDLLHRLLGVEGEDVVQAVLDAEDLLGLDGDVRGLALRPAPGLVHEDARVGQREALAAPEDRRLSPCARAPHTSTYSGPPRCVPASRRPPPRWLPGPRGARSRRPGCRPWPPSPSRRAAPRGTSSSPSPPWWGPRPG